MNKSLALLTALIISITLIMGVSTAAGTPDEFIIPVNSYVNFSNNMTVELIQLTVSNITYGGAYSVDPINTTWPVLVFKYQNNGKSQAACRLHVKLVDNASVEYDKTDMTIPYPLSPGQESTLVTLEWAVPKGRTVTKLIVVDDALKSTAAEIPLVYPALTPSSAPLLGPGLLGEGGESFRNLMLIPILLGLAGLIGWFMARRRLF